MTDSPAVTPEAESADAMVEEGVRLAWEAGEHEAALSLWEEVIAKHGTSRDPKVLWCVKVALLKKGLLLVELHRWKEAVAAYGQVAVVYAPKRHRIVQAALGYVLVVATGMAVLLRLQRFGDWLVTRFWSWLPEDYPGRRLRDR